MAIHEATNLIQHRMRQIFIAYLVLLLAFLCSGGAVRFNPGGDGKGFFKPNSSFHRLVPGIAGAFAVIPFKADSLCAMSCLGRLEPILVFKRVSFHFLQKKWTEFILVRVRKGKEKSCGGFNYDSTNNSCMLLNISRWDPGSVDIGPGTENKQFYLSSAKVEGTYTAKPAVVSSPLFTISNPVSRIHHFLNSFSVVCDIRFAIIYNK